MPVFFPDSRRLGLLLLTAAGSLTVFSCEKTADQVGPQSSQSASASTFAVSEAQARTVAENVAFSPNVLAQIAHNRQAQNADTQYVFRGRQRILRFTPVLAADGQPGLYFCNFAGGGFAIVAADRHLEPILAYSSRGSLPTTLPRDGGAATPEGFASWVGGVLRATATLRQNAEGNAPYPGSAKLWSKLGGAVEQSGFTEKPGTTPGSTSKPAPEPDPNPPCYSTQVGPLLQSNWGQNCGYNDYTPSTGNGSYCYHCPTGCVATATAQVMKYWQYPARYNWSAMPTGSGATATAGLMRDLGNSLYMDYRETSSGTDDDYIDDKLKSDYGYSSADYISNESGMIQRIQDDLRVHRPVIIGGYSDTTFGYGSGSGHCWVTDGYTESSCDGYSSLTFHMNWGYEGSYNGWYNAYNWEYKDSNGNVHNYNHAKSCTVNIHP